MSFMKDFNYLKIQMKDIVLATRNFDATKEIGHGGFGRVYKGELSSRDGRIIVTFKKLDPRLGQGSIEFWKEIMMLSRYKHENLISLKHFCNEGDEMILVYEYAAHGSLDQHLSDASTLTWIQRLKICVGAARGLQFLHDPKDTQHRVIHRDVKSANILLDENWTAKVSDFGLSKIGLANQGNTYMVSHGVGTPGYCDPLYLEFGFLSKESDVYSFGVVLFEILCGRLCYEYRDRQLDKILVPGWKRCYDEKRLDEIILPGLKEQMDAGSLKSYSAIAYQCVKRAREERPMMAKIVKELEFSLEQQEIFENTLKSGHREVDAEEAVGYALVEILEGSDMKPSDMNRLANPYIKGKLGVYRFRTKVQKKTSSPKWDEEFRIPIASWDSPNLLEIGVYDKDPPYNYTLGDYSVEINELGYGRRHDMWLALHNIKMGTLHLAIKVIEAKDMVFEQQYYDNASKNEFKKEDGSDKLHEKSKKMAADHFEQIDVEPSQNESSSTDESLEGMVRRELHSVDSVVRKVMGESLEDNKPKSINMVQWGFNKVGSLFRKSPETGGR